VGVLGFGLGGCNAGGNNLLEANRALNERVTALTAENDSLKATNQQLQAALSGRDRALMEMQALVDEMKGGDSGAMARLREMQERLDRMKFGSLDPQTDAALRELAAQHPDLIEYIPELGLLRFKSDVTFDSGSDAVKDAARPTLRQLAEILNGAAGSYDVKILGHTDAQGISRTKAQHPTNMHLSAHRAISVRRELVGMGVAAPRFEIAGRGEFDPIVPNGPDGKAAQNRRVEVYLMKPMSRTVSAPSGDASDTAPAAPARAPAAAPPKKRAEEIMK
jgi:chemotaxis protein MotB